MTWRRIYGPHRSDWCGDDSLYEEESIYGWGPFLPDLEDGTPSGACEFEYTVAYYVVALDGERVGEAHELAVAEHAGEEQPAAEHADLDRELVGELGIRERPRHHADGAGQRREDELALVPAGAVEAEDERQQVQRQRHDPQQRHRRDVLRDVVGHGEQQ